MFTSYTIIHAEVHAARRRWELLAEAEHDRLVAPSAGGAPVGVALGAAVGRLSVLRLRRGSALASAPRSPTAA